MVAVEDGLQSLQPAAVVHIGSLTSGSEKRALQSIPRRCAYRPKTKPPVPDFRKPAAFFPATLPLGLDDPRSYEENQLLVRSSDGCVFEQVAQPWNAAQQRNLRNANRVVGLNDATDAPGPAVGDVIQTNNSVSVSQVPLLGSIPWLGNLFKHTAVATSNQELIFFITPRIIQT